MYSNNLREITCHKTYVNCIILIINILSQNSAWWGEHFHFLCSLLQIVVWPFGHCVVCPFLIAASEFSNVYLLWLTACDYPFGIFKDLLHVGFVLPNSNLSISILKPSPQYWVNTDMASSGANWFILKAYSRSNWFVLFILNVANIRCFILITVEFFSL